MRLNASLILGLCALSLLLTMEEPPTVILTASAGKVIASPPACDTPYREAACAPTSPLIELSAAADGFEGRELIYKYTVSSGKLVGEGPKVTWDLTGLPPGVYELRVEVEDGRGGRAAGAKKVDVMRCTCPLIPPPPR